MAEELRIESEKSGKIIMSNEEENSDSILNDQIVEKVSEYEQLSQTVSMENW